MFSVQKNNWMSGLNETLTLDRISIPGTHDSGTAKAPPIGARTQNFGIYTQLNDGIRFLDIRVTDNGTEDDPLNIYHGIISCDISLGDVLDDCLLFLKENPSETIIMLMNAATSSVKGVQEKFDYYAEQEKYSDLFYLDTKVPTLKQSRSKIVLLRRFSGSSGIDLSHGWKVNETFTLTTPQNQVFEIEDQYKEHDTHKKMAAVEYAINRAIDAPEDGVIHITYNSIAQGWHTPYQYCWGGGIGTVIPQMNPGLTEFLQVKQKGDRLGIIVLDFYNNEVGNIDNRNTEIIINTNSGLALV
ncbi:phosphatidylinositol-specific phospholipase C [Vibrio alginolyticus]|uniref:phosphatidylinositol-specific phospholipase C n=1 Tax=Vibrio alginolyticus TaxID=663 RepID=UPI003D7CD5CD